MAEGDIGAIIESFDLKAGLPGTEIRGFDLIHFSGDVYVMAYHDKIAGVNHGRLATITIDSLGDIGAAPIDILEFWATLSFAMALIKISDTVVAVAYTNNTGRGVVTTVSVDGVGNLGAIIDTLVFDLICGTGNQRNVIRHVSGDIYAIVRRGTDNDGYLVTVTIDSDGNIGAAVEDTLEFDGVDCDHPDLFHVAGEVYTIVYRGNAGVGTIITVSIDAAGTIGAIDSLQFDLAATQYLRVRPVSGEIYAIVYDELLRGYIDTLTIDAAGNIGAVIDTQEISVANQGWGPSILHVSGDVYLVVFSGDSGVGGDDFYAKTHPIDAAGNIGANISSLKLADSSIPTSEMPVVYVGGQVYAALYSGLTSAVLVTFPVETLLGGAPASGDVAHKLLMAAAI